VVHASQSGASLLTADGLTIANVPTSPRETRVRGFCGSLSGRKSRRSRFHSMFTPGLLTCAYKTASGRREWPNRDPLSGLSATTLGAVFRSPVEVTEGPNLFKFSLNNPLYFVDSDGRSLLEFPYVIGPTVADARVCAERIRWEVAPYCGGNLQAPDDPSCREAHCIASCRIARECPGGAAASEAAGIWREFTMGGGWSWDSWGDSWANQRGICKAFFPGKKCEDRCKGVR
jgi:hypothetical protein